MARKKGAGERTLTSVEMPEEWRDMEFGRFKMPKPGEMGKKYASPL